MTFVPDGLYAVNETFFLALSSVCCQYMHAMLPCKPRCIITEDESMISYNGRDWMFLAAANTILYSVYIQAVLKPCWQ